jgi:translation initiation factor eIF-2B subunit delta
MTTTTTTTTPMEAAAGATAAAAPSTTTTTSIEKKPKKTKAPPPSLVIPAKVKPLTKAERRALQEQQRAAKLAAAAAVASGGGGGSAAASTSAATAASGKDSTTTSNSATASIAGAAAAAAAHAPAKEFTTDGSTAASVTLTSKSTKSVLVSHLPLPYSDIDDPVLIFDTGETVTAAAAAADSVLFHLPVPVMELGRAYATGSIRGGHARCRAMLECLALLLDAANPPPPLMSSQSATTTTTTTDVRTLVDALYWKPAFTFWTEHCRPHSIAMGNAYAFCKSAALCVVDTRDVTWERLVPLLQATIWAYIRERLDFAVTAIAELACTKLLQLHVPPPPIGHTNLPHNLHNLNHAPDLVILTYGYSEAVCAVLLQAASTLSAATTTPQRLRVICVDSPPLLEGRKLLNRLLQETSGRDEEAVLECCYIHLAAVSYVLPTVTKVLLGAAALQSDGSVTGRIGTAVVALLAHHQNCPVLVCAETFKISNRSVQLESLAYNELLGRRRHHRHRSSPADVDGPDTKDDLVERLDLLYDLTPAAHVSGIVTELGIVPPSSIAVLLREMNQPTDWKR